MILESDIAERTKASRVSGSPPAVSTMLIYLRSMGVFALIWYAGAWWIGNSTLLPSPVAVVQSLFSLITSGDVASNATGSLTRLAISFAAATLIGVPLGLLMGMSRTLYALVDP